MSSWIAHVQAQAASKKISFSAAMKDPGTRSSYEKSGVKPPVPVLQPIRPSVGSAPVAPAKLKGGPLPRAKSVKAAEPVAAPVQETGAKKVKRSGEIKKAPRPPKKDKAVKL